MRPEKYLAAREPTICRDWHHHACACHEAAVAKLVEALEKCIEIAGGPKWDYDGDEKLITIARAALDEWRKV